MSSDKENLIDKLKTLNQTVWEGRADRNQINRWIAQFKSDPDPAADEQLQMLFLLSNFMYFGGREIRALLRALFRDFYKHRIVSAIRRSNGDTLDRNFISQEFKKLLEATRFLGVGNPSESGTHLLYYFRQENQLGKGFFINAHEVFSRDCADPGRVILRDDKVKYYVFLDDLCGSGTQAELYSKDIVEPLRSLSSGCQVFYYVLFATSAGIKQVKALNRFDDVACVFELDDTFRTFSTESRYYAKVRAPIDKAAGERICRSYGSKLWAENPLGYKDGQLLLGLNHNTPDNTIPVFWHDEPNGVPWTPIFRRYPKWYNMES